MHQCVAIQNVDKCPSRVKMCAHYRFVTANRNYLTLSLEWSQRPKCAQYDFQKGT